MASYRIKCVDKDKNSFYKDCRCIRFIGVSAEGGGVNKYSPARMHDRIKNGENFFILHNGKEVYLIAVMRESTKYVRTEPNDTEQDNLLKQSSCTI